MNVITKFSSYLAQCHYTKTVQRIFKYSDIQYTSLTVDIKLNSLIYRTLFYVNIYESYKLLENSPVFWPTLYIAIDIAFCVISNRTVLEKARPACVTCPLP